MPPAIIDQLATYRAALLNQEQGAMQSAARRWLQVETAINAQVDALALEMANADTVTMGQLSRSVRYQALRRQINAELDRYAAYMDDSITRGQRNMATMALQHSAAAIDSVATQAQMVVNFNRLPVSAVSDMIGLAGDGSPLRAVLDDAARGAGDALGQQLVNGVALGKNPIAVARQAIRLGLGQSFTRMQTISRTEMLRTYRLSTLAQYQASRVVSSYVRLSARDDRVCAACLFADGTVYQLNEGFDQHPNCRCTLLPRLYNVPPVEFQTGQEWFTEQPESTQRTILGRGRFDLWRRGEASLSDMVSRDWSDTWGGSLRVTNVGRLRSGAGRVWAGGGPVASAQTTPVAPRVPQWSPSMSRADAELWAAQSAIKQDTYHVTPGVGNERAIKANGFDLSRRQFGRMWGDGVYVGMDQNTADLYVQWSGSSARKLTIKTNVQNPYVFTPTGKKNFEKVDVVMEALGITKSRANKILNEVDGDISRILQNAGYDALHVNIKGAGGNQMVIFDPKKVVVVND